MQLPLPSRSLYGAFAAGEETLALAYLRELLINRGITAAGLINAFEAVVDNDARVQRALDAAQRLFAGHEDAQLIPPIVELMYFTGHQGELQGAGFLFPPYSTLDTYARNVGNPILTELPSRPRVEGVTWQFLGHPIGFPIGVGASPFTDNSRWIRALAGNGFNVFTYRTVRSRSRESALPPNWIPVVQAAGLEHTPGKHPIEVVAAANGWLNPGSTDVSTANFFGVPSSAPKHWRDDLAEALEAIAEDQLIMVSVLGEDYEKAHNEDSLVRDFVATASHAVEAGASVLEINLSCPNSLDRDGNPNNLLCHSWGLSGRIVKGIRDELGRNVDLVVKLADMNEYDLGSLVRETGREVDAYAGINAIPSVVSGVDGQAALATRVGGVGGSQIHQAAVDFVTALSRERFRQGLTYEIVGLGGVTSPATFLDLYMAGASVVQSVSGVFANPLLAFDCVASLGDALPLAPPDAVGISATEVKTRLVEAVREHPAANQYLLANELPLSAATTLDLLDAMVEEGDLLADPKSKSAWGVESVRYRAVG